MPKMSVGRTTRNGENKGDGLNANKCELSKVQILLACFMQNKNIILKAYSTQKVGSGGNFESGSQGYAADGKYKRTI